MNTTQLKPAIDLAQGNGVRFPNESDEYRHARDALLAEEIELRRHSAQELRAHWRERPGQLLGAIRRQTDVGRLQLYVRPVARAALPDV